MYAVFSLLIFRLLFRLTLSAKIAAYGVLFHTLLAGVLTRNVTQEDVGAYSESIGGLLLIAVIGLAVSLKKQMSSETSS